MKKKIISLFLLLGTSFIQNSINAQIIHNESFDVNQILPTGWVTVGAAADWGRSTTFSNPLVGGPHTGAGMARMRNQSNSPNALTETISTPVFDLTGRGTNIVPVSFWIYRDSLVPANIDSLGVFVNTAASLTGATKIGTVARNRSVNVPDTKAANGWYQYTFNIPLSFTGTSNFILFQGTVYGPTATARRVYIDDIEWMEYPPICTGAPNGGAILSSLSLICGGSGSANLTLNGASTGTGITYQWYESLNQTGPYSPFGTNSMNTSTGSITTTQYYYSLASCSGSGISVSSDTIAITVNPNPNPVLTISLANDTICRFDTLNITAAGAVTYQWSTAANPNFSSTATLTDIPFNTTTYTVIGSDALGCSSLPITQTIVVGRRPTINSFTLTNDTICSGGSSILTVNASSGVGGGGGGGVTLLYDWNPNVGTTNSVTVSPTLTTQYFVTVLGQYGCSTTDSATVNVNLNLISPIISITPDSVDICQGIPNSTVDLVASSNVAGTTYTWTASFGAPITSTNDSLTINVGNNTVTYTVTGTDVLNGCFSAAQSVVYVRPKPNVNLVSQNTTVCLNGSVVLTTQVTNTQGTPLNQYTFNYNPTATNSQTINYSPLATGYVYVDVTSPYGCATNDSLMITIDPTLISPNLSLLSSVNSLCSDNLLPIELVATSDAILPNYSWTPNFISQNNDTVTVSPQNSTNYSVTVTDQNGCSTSTSLSVIVNQAPVASFTSTTLPSMDVSFANTSANASSYLWNFGDGTTSTLVNPVHGYASNGTFTVSLIALTADGCDDTTSMTIQAQTNGIKELSSDFILFPNPTNGIITLQSKNQVSGTMYLLTAAGAIIMVQELTNVETQLDLTHLDLGLYLIQITNNVGLKSIHRIVKN